ncbi:putative quinol monooxygenase [Crossiella sp. CA198]|uniref:putative quinol monooxygenase n=1 Tax=Crossiella sp. CA198 TaxID=3455607 RepID=UPI003F8D8BA3
MVIATVDFSTAPADRVAALAQFDAERDRVRAMPGNRDFRIFASREDDGQITVLHEWVDVESFRGYLASESFASFGAVVRPLTVGAPVSRRFLAEPVEIG